ncbi:hypothetical protein G5B38_05670 [Pseudohalocynthiibacter aestuariivivens]|uniref:PH domain-containing protein n=1 Tax=Roseovarius pelagicus TaxID=2980108 RepID=A0ABY6DAW1_9RHOB|nr:MULTISPECIES: hypothetical protein [Rhodobacterales]QIE45060.1 hypothetical protein G5B38_05670 [Pseudohalocynthiibacter aestuariivivens]UXX83004.1 hypothetical protein N7U68_18310 [Roseovarius pelagicus]
MTMLPQSALPQTYMPEGPARKEAPIPSHHFEAEHESPLRSFVYRCTGVAAMLAAVGIWLVPVVPGDAAMQLAKVVMSAALVLGGGTLFASLRRADGPTIEIDTRRRLLTIIDHDTRGKVRMTNVHSVDSLSEIVLRDGLLTARDAQGRSLLAIGVTDEATKMALRQMLGRGLRPA